MRTRKRFVLLVLLLLSNLVFAQKIKILVWTGLFGLCTSILLYKIFLPYIPISILEELENTNCYDQISLLPRKNDNYKIQGGWIKYLKNKKNNKLTDKKLIIAINCNTDQEKACDVYFNCLSCIFKDFSAREYYKGQAKTKLGRIFLKGITGPFGVNEYYSGWMYDPDEYIKGNLIKYKVSLVTHEKGTLPIKFMSTKNNEEIDKDQWINLP